MPPRQQPTRHRFALAALSAAGGLILVFLWSQLAFSAVLLPPAGAIAWTLAVTGAFLVLYGHPMRWNRRLRVWSRLRWPPRALGWTAALAPGLFLLVLSLAVFLLAAGLARPDEFQEPIHRLLALPLGGVAFALLVVLAAPVIEEVGFRGWIQGSLEHRLDPRTAVAISAVLFGVMHLGSTLLPARIAGGLVLGHAVLATRSAWTGILLHAAWNALMLATDVLLPEWDPTGAGWSVAGPAALGVALSAAWCLWALRGLETSAARGRS